MKSAVLVNLVSLNESFDSLSLVNGLCLGRDEPVPSLWLRVFGFCVDFGLEGMDFFELLICLLNKVHRPSHHLLVVHRLVHLFCYRSTVTLPYDFM